MRPGQAGETNDANTETKLTSPRTPNTSERGEKSFRLDKDNGLCRDATQHPTRRSVKITPPIISGVVIYWIVKKSSIEGRGGGRALGGNI